MPKLSAEKYRAGRYICNTCGTGAAILRRTSFGPGGDNQIVPRSAIVRATTPAGKRLTRELLGLIATKIPLTTTRPGAAAAGMIAVGFRWRETSVISLC